MQAKKRDNQGLLFKIRLDHLCNQNDALYRLTDTIDGSSFDESFGKLSTGIGRPAKPTRLMAGLHYLKHAFNLSDEEVVLTTVQ